MDSGSSGTLLSHDLGKKLRIKPTAATEWKTAAGTFNTKGEVKVTFALPEFHTERRITHKVAIAKDLGYDMILGRDLLHELGIILDFSRDISIWDRAEVPMKQRDCTIDDSFHVPEEHMNTEMDRVKKILDAKYEPADLPDVVRKCTHLNDDEQSALLKLLQKHTTLFDGTLGKWKGEPYNVELKEDVKPYHARPFPVPKVHEQTLKMELERLCQIGVLKKVNRSEWAAPSFLIPKKDGTVRFISDFRELNTRIKRKPYPIPKIQDMLLKLEGFKYATSLDLNMGYYHVELSPDSKRLCTIVFPFGKYEYQRLPMGLCNSPDIFQERMSELFADLEYVRAYIDDLLCLTTSTWEDHLNKLDQILERLKDAGLKVNAKKSFFGKDSLEYLGYWVTREGIRPLEAKVSAIKDIAVPKNKKELRRFIGLVNYYRDMWIRRSDVLAPLSALTSKDSKWRWEKVEQNAFDTMKRIVGQETLLAYPNFNEPFDIHTDASHTQLGAVISQKGRPIAFYSRKLNAAQTRYTTTERELLAIVETLKEFRTILLGQQLRVYTDHKNLTFKNFNTERVMRWRLLIEEFNPELIYIKGERNIVADALSRLDIAPSVESEKYPGSALGPNSTGSSEALSMEYYGNDKQDLPASAFPLGFKIISKAQSQDEELKELALSNVKYELRTLRSGGKERNLIYYEDKICVPKELQQRIIDWYHIHLCHPGENRTEQTIRQHFHWNGMRKQVADTVKTCPTCQKAKRRTRKYGYLPPKEPEVTPWETLCVDLVGPYHIPIKGTKEKSILWAVTMIDPATGWFEMTPITGKTAIEIMNNVEISWLTRYPWPVRLQCDRGTEFMNEFALTMQKDYGTDLSKSTVRNPQSNAILERIHQTLGNIIRTFEVHKDASMTSEESWQGIIAAAMFALRSTYHTTLQATPAQLVFGRDSVMNVQCQIDWTAIKERKRKLINSNNAKENAKRTPYTYHVGDKILVKQEWKAKYADSPYKGPYEITKVSTNGTVRYQKGSVEDVINIRNITPYYERS